jgi:hypothetical protein
LLLLSFRTTALLEWISYFQKGPELFATVVLLVEESDESCFFVCLVVHFGSSQNKRIVEEKYKDKQNLYERVSLLPVDISLCIDLGKL